MYSIAYAQFEESQFLELRNQVQSVIHQVTVLSRPDVECHSMALAEHHYKDAAAQSDF